MSIEDHEVVSRWPRSSQWMVLSIDTEYRMLIVVGGWMKTRKNLRKREELLE